MAKWEYIPESLVLGYMTPVHIVTQIQTVNFFFLLQFSPENLSL